MTHDTLQERLISEMEKEFDKRFTAVDWSEKRSLIDIAGLDLLPDLKDFIKKHTLHTIEQTIKEGCGNRYKMPDGTTPEIVFIGMYKDNQYYQEALTDTQHALRGIIG